MRNFILLLVLVSGLLAGYFIGDYRGRDARETLGKAIETGKTLEAERMTTISRLKTELESINEKHRQELAATRKDNDARMAGWRRTKSDLANTITHTTATLAESDNKLKSLISQRDSASGADKAKIELEIAPAERTGKPASGKRGRCMPASPRSTQRI